MSIDQNLALIREAGWASTSATTTAANQVMSLALARPPFVTAGKGVNSCEEYAYKRWGDYSAFAFAAKRFRTNYREIFKLATDPSSPVLINKTLRQTGTNTPTPKQVVEGIPGNRFVSSAAGTPGQPDTVYEPLVYANPFTTIDPTLWVPGGDPLRTPAVTRALARPKSFRAKSDTSPLGVHKEARATIEARYGTVTDDELADIAKRVALYGDLVAKRIAVEAELVCASGTDPCWRSSDPPNPGAAGLPSGLQNGLPKIDPADNVLLQTTNPVLSAQTLSILANAGKFMAELDRDAMSGTAQRVYSAGGAVAVGTNACTRALSAKRPSLMGALSSINADLKRLFAAEVALGNRGCLDAPTPDAPNICDWSYPMFAEMVTTMFDKAVEADYRAYKTGLANAITGMTVGSPVFTNVLRVPEKQQKVFPCVWRRDFTGSAPDVAAFFEHNVSSLGRSCEAERQNLATSDEQARWADELAGLEWKPFERKIQDTETDAMTLGDRDTLGAYVSYDTRWTLKGTQLANNDSSKTCAFTGDAGNDLKTGLYFFGDDLKLLTLSGAATRLPMSSSRTSAASDFLELRVQLGEDHAVGRRPHRRSRRAISISRAFRTRTSTSRALPARGRRRRSSRRSTWAASRQTSG